MATEFRSNTSSPVNPTSTAYDRVVFDNLLRRELKVGDPSNAAEIAQALLRRYQSDPRAAALTQEAQGLPFQQTLATTPVVQAAPTATDNEWQQAVSDVERDLRELTTSALLKDVTAELTGWTDAIRSAMREGENAAQFGLDPHQRDKAFAIRRQLGDYARLARLAGALNQPVRNYYRQLACSLDEAASVILVKLGEALTSISGGRFLLQAPYSELQTRRDAVIFALRNLVGATQEAYDPNTWPRGLDAYRQLFARLDEQGQGDLRSLLVEGELTRIMDELMHRAANGQPDGLRAVGATAQIDLARFRRLVLVAHRWVRPESPALHTFLHALTLFADAFNSAGGHRLLRIARPPILLYGLYGSQALSSADERLLELVRRRTAIAEQVDCISECECARSVVCAQVVVDSVLYIVDRAIDLYALGEYDFGPAEVRASAYAYYVLAALGVRSEACDPAVRLIEHVSEDMRTELRLLIPLLAPFNVDDQARPSPMRSWDDSTTWVVFNSEGATRQRQNELSVYWHMEATRMRSIASLGASCVPEESILAVLGGVAVNALGLNHSHRTSPDTTCIRSASDLRQIDIPPHYETSLDGIAHNVARDGYGRGQDDADVDP